MVIINSKNARMWSRLGPSGAVGVAALELAEHYSKAVMLTADLCYFSGLERFRAHYPDRLYNFGIAEQNMLGAAGGLAREGYIPFASTYASFCTSRCADQVRVNMSYMQLPIKMIGLTAGYGAGVLGATHMSIEDIAFMRALPNITVISPADCTEIIKSMMAAVETNAPTYIRLTGPINTPVVYEEDYDFKIGRAVFLKKGCDICFVATGSMVSQAKKAADILELNGISCSVINMHTIKPLDEEILVEVADTHRIIATVEEHSVFGGLGSAVCEFLAQRKNHPLIKVFGIEDFFAKPGEYQYQLKQSGLTGEQIAEKIKILLHTTC